MSANNSTANAPETVIAAGPAMPLTVRLAALRQAREQSPDGGLGIDTAVLKGWDRSIVALQEAQAAQSQVRELLNAMTAPPHFSATFLGSAEMRYGLRGAVMHGGVERLVTFANGVDPASILIGDQVFLNHELNVIVDKNPHGRPRHGETAVFDRWDSEHIVLRARGDEEVLARPVARLQSAQLKSGDRVVWDRQSCLAYDVLARAERYQLGETSEVEAGAVGGHRASFKLLVDALTTVLLSPEIAQSYGLQGRRSIMMHGPPGCGKTLMARAATARVRALTGQRSRFFSVKPCEWESPWVGTTEINIRECFANLREAAKDGMAVLFLDEVESIGRTRGGLNARHDDAAVAALLAEIDGIEKRGNVVIISATNRKELIDPALLERLSEIDISVPRPDLAGARAIFDIHLPATFLFSPNGELAGDTRRQIIEAAVGRLYSPNSEDAPLCKLKFRDGSVRAVAPSELISGRLIAQICSSACSAACTRHAVGGAGGLTVGDMHNAIGAAIARLATTLSVRNVHSYLADLPTDMDVIAVETSRRRVTRPRDYVVDMSETLVRCVAEEEEQ